MSLLVALPPKQLSNATDQVLSHKFWPIITAISMGNPFDVAQALIDRPLTYSVETCLFSDRAHSTPRLQNNPVYVELHEVEPAHNDAIHQILGLYGLIPRLHGIFEAWAAQPRRPLEQQIEFARLADEFLVLRPSERWITPHS